METLHHDPRPSSQLKGLIPAPHEIRRLVGVRSVRVDSPLLMFRHRQSGHFFRQERPNPDRFLIGAHALEQPNAPVTLEDRIYRAAFPHLKTRL
jgi:hypothetical protein